MLSYAELIWCVSGTDSHNSGFSRPGCKTCDKLRRHMVFEKLFLCVFKKKSVKMWKNKCDGRNLKIFFFDLLCEQGVEQ